MKICFPIRKQNGDEYSTVEEVMGLTGRESHGSWLAGTNQLWHGGIHISQTSAPGSVLTADNADSAVPLQCMAKGEVVAWRLNQDYKKADYSGKELKYSTTFILVKSICQPDPEKENCWLEFYSLYMGLAPLSAFSKSLCYKAKTDVKKRAASNYVSSASSDRIAAAPPKCGTLTKDKRVVVLKQTQFRNDGQTQPFGLARSLSDSGEMEDETFWVTLQPEFMEPDEEQYVQMPAWMQKAVALGKFDEVVKPPEKLEMAAGDAVGFLGEDIAPAGRSNTDSCHYVHIEVISNDTRMPEFLNNPAGITSGQKYIRLHPGADLYTKSGEGEQSVFTKTTSQTEKDSGKILCVADCYPFEDSQHRTWYKVSDNSWMSRDGVDLLNQYDLKELGFNTLEEAPSPDVSKSLREDWVKGAYNWLSERVGKERGIQQKQVSAFYKNLVKKIDSDGDGELSGKELYNALHHPELGLRDIVARLIVKHDSEWFGGSSHHRWNVFFQNYDRLRVAYAKQWLDDSEWMSQVDAFKEGKPVWHFHPVMFLSNLADINVHKRRDNNLGTLSSHYETGGRGSRTVSGGVGDAGGVSYGSYQMTSQTTKKIHGELRVIIGGTVKIFVTSGDFRWRSEFANLTPGTTAFTSKWKELVDAHPDDFKDAEHQFIKETHFDKLVQHTINETNVDVRYHSHTLNDVVWSTAVHHGPENNVIINAINATGFTPAENKIYDEALIKAIYQERGRKKTDGKLAYFSKNSLEVQAGVSSRFIREGKEALERLKNESDY